MRIANVPIGPRRGAALGGLAAGVVAVVLILWGVPVTPVVTGALGAALLVAVAMVLAELRRMQRVAAAGERAAVERWQQVREANQRAHQETAERMRGLRGSIEARLDTVTRLHERTLATDLLHQAAVRRRLDGDAVATASLADEIALIRASDVFDADHYQAQLGMAVADPVAHYVDRGAELGIDPHPLFVTIGYLNDHPDALTTWRTPLAHFLAAERPADPAPRHGHRGSGQAGLKREYLARGLHREPDTFVLYRIIGNDLPPRHRAGQGLDNLRFVLAHEPELPGCQKRWVVNRIVDPRIEKQILSLLDEHGQAYLHLPFRPEEYRRVGWRFERLEPPGLTYRREYDSLNPNQRQRVLDHVYHHKNLYVMNNNGARNAALRQGRGLAKWVLPWDGNCFLTREAWDELVAAVTDRPYLKYFTVPMARVTDNAALLRPGLRVVANEEPQLVFRRDAREEFNPSARYGRRPKVELFYRLRIPGPWDHWGREPWDDAHPAPSPEAGQTGEAGWVARLFSGEQAAEADSRDRQWRRVAAIRDCIDQVDQQLAAEVYEPDRLFTIDEDVLERQRARGAAGEPEPARVLAALVEAAAPRREPRLLPEVLDGITTAALAGHLTGQARFFRRGAELIRERLLGRRGRIPPAREPRFSIVDTHGIGPALDAARLLAREQALTGADSRRFRDWLVSYRQWLTEHESGREHRSALDHRGTWYDVQLAEIDAYLGDLCGLLETLRRAHERIAQQYGEDGDPAAGHAPGGDLTNLLGWTRLAAGGRRLGHDLWLPPLAGACQRVLADAPPVADADRWAVLAHVTATSTDMLEAPMRDPWRVRQVFPAGAGVRPFWVLGNEVGIR